MKVVQFDFSRFIDDDPFRSNRIINRVYMQISEKVFSLFYKAFPFNQLFNGSCGTNEPPIESLKQAIVCWADAFMDWHIDDEQRAVEAVEHMIHQNITPTLGLFRAVYMKQWDFIKTSLYEEYISYLYRFTYTQKDGRIHGAKCFNEWHKERDNEHRNTRKDL